MVEVTVDVLEMHVEENGHGFLSTILTKNKLLITLN